jgi:hypothetical protein
MDAVVPSPGTVSRILWHFTGGPVWNESERKQGSSPKPAVRAYENLKSIIRARQLRLGGYKEVIRVRFDERRRYNPTTKKNEIERNVSEELTSSPVCCLADVPVIHLSYLAQRYGKFAIGFHRESVVRHGFNPVFYALENARSILSIYRGLGQIESIDGEIFRLCGQYTRESVDAFLASNGLAEGPDDAFLTIIPQQADYLDESLREARASLGDFLGLVKTFSPEEFGSIYCEREWRSLEPYTFTYDDIAMIVLPRKVGATAYFQPFCEKAFHALNLPSTIPVVPWEDLVEH